MTTDDPVQLPHAARPLVARADYSKFTPVFALYLSQEKQIRLSDLEEKAKTDPRKDREVQSRWRRFVDKWNAHELDDKWYDPQLFLRAIKGTADVKRTDAVEEEDDDDEDDSGSDSDYGPALPPAEGELVSRSTTRHAGPAIPSRADLDERRALEEEDREAERSALKLARRADRAEQRERLEDLVPRAAAGTRERKLEKKKELNEKMRGFRDRSPGGEVNDDELMGDDGGASQRSIQDKKEEAELAAAKRTFWQLRREEEQRARDQELEERRMQYRAREEETMDMLRELARQRFGS
ncbi:hypothetical protein Sste5344_008218 [Sporothrix stenoceras]